MSDADAELARLNREAELEIQRRLEAEKSMEARLAEIKKRAEEESD